MKAGIYQGGVRDVRSLKLRCVIDDITGCWLHPVNRIWVRLPEGGYATMNRRRAAVVVSTGANLPPELLAYRAPHCASPHCARPDHAETGDRTSFMRALSAVGALHTPARRETWARCCVARRKLLPDQVGAIAADRRRAKDIAAEYGCSVSRVNQIRSSAGVGRRRVPSSVFNFRPGSACSLSK